MSSCTAPQAASERSRWRACGMKRMALQSIRWPRRQGHFPAKADRVIFLYSTGGVSHVDTFDHKPAAHPRSRQRPSPPRAG
ncbi:MAG: hypothetical protein V9G29_04560 [Burkholderiaceae bacterium]